MSQTSRIVQEKTIPVPKHLLKYRDEKSPYRKNKEFKKTIGSRILVNTKKTKNGVSRVSTFSAKTQENDIENLINVEKNYVRELFESPIKIKSKSPLLTQKTKIISQSKSKLIKNRFESLTVCDFLGITVKRRTTDNRRSKFSFTPELSNKRK